LRGYASANAKSPLGARLVALGTFFGAREEDRATLVAWKNDATPLPRCEPSDRCMWECGPRAWPKPVATVGEFVERCVEPTLAGIFAVPEARSPFDDDTGGLVVYTYDNPPPSPRERKVSGTVAIGAMKIDGQIAGADRVVAGRLRALARTCYTQGLERDEKLAGSIVLWIDVAPDGDVTSTKIAENEGLPPQVTQCIATAARRLRFEKSANGASVKVPLEFEPAR
jgi:hypothetical protein